MPEPAGRGGPRDVPAVRHDHALDVPPLELLDDAFPRGTLWPYVEQNVKVFQCPRGVDLDAASATFGQPFQCSYAMNYVTGGPGGRRLERLANGNGTSAVALTSLSRLSVHSYGLLAFLVWVSCGSMLFIRGRTTV